MTVVLVTGAAGRIGGYLRAGLPPLGWSLRGLDLAATPGPDGDTDSDGDGDGAHDTGAAGKAGTAGTAGIPWFTGDIADPAVLAPAMAGADAVVHLAGIPTEAPFAELRHANIDGAYQVFEAARRAGVRRVVYASSNHAVGYHPAAADLTTAARPRPDTLYGVTKVFGEALGSFYADRHGLDVAALRIGSCFDRPPGVRGLATWLSPADAVRLVDAVLRAPSFGFRVLYGISANTRARWDLGPARSLGYRPQDDAEVFAASVLAEQGPLPDDDPDLLLVGGRLAAGSS